MCIQLGEELKHVIQLICVEFFEIKQIFSVLSDVVAADGIQRQCTGVDRYLNEYDREMARRSVPVILYADDIVVLAKSPRVAQRLLESTQRYLEGKLKLRMNVEKSKVVSVYSI